MARFTATRILRHPRFVDWFTVERRAETVNDYGESTVAATTMRAHGIVMPADDNAGDIGTDERHQGKSFSIVTTFRLQGPAPGFQPDVVVFRGDRYVVMTVNDCSHMGEGFVQAVVRSLDQVDAPPKAAAKF